MRNFFATYYNASPYMEKYVLEALCTMGYYEDALKRMGQRFGEMVAAPHSTLWEGWEYTGGKGMKYKSGNGTYNHAWSGGGLTILSQYIAGIEPITPKFEQFRVSPNLATLTRVKSVVPTESGNIVLSAERKECKLEMTLTVPASRVAKVIVPQGYTTIACNGNEGVELTLTQGEYFITATK